MKLDMELVKQSGRPKSELPLLQTCVYTMCGGGMLGRFAATQPADFYIDDRVGKLPYSQRDICQAVEVLKTLAEVWGYDPHDLPDFSFHNCGVF